MVAYNSHIYSHHSNTLIINVNPAIVNVYEGHNCGKLLSGLQFCKETLGYNASTLVSLDSLWLSIHEKYELSPEK